MRKTVTIVAACLCLAACNKIGFAGNSITVVSKDKMVQKAQATGHAAYVAADVAKVIKQIDGLIQQGLVNNPDTYAVVVEAGTNDVGTDNADWQTDYDTLISHIVDRPCVVLTTVSGNADLINPPAPYAAEAIDVYLRAQVASHPTFRLVDWDLAVKTIPNLTSDSIHPTPAGQQWLADHDVAAVQDCEAQ